VSRLSTYVVQPDPKTKCPMCGRPVDMLCDHKGNVRKPWFYICWFCRNVVQLGVGPVTREE
jgi:hypothetical protein